jgi:glycosyltransferase involved in cell wall biosynthesis
MFEIRDVSSDHTRSKKRVLIVEPYGEGHQFILYVTATIRAIRDQGWDCELLTSVKAISHPAYEQMCREIGGSLKVHIIPDFKENDKTGVQYLVVGQIIKWWSVRAAIRSLRAEEMFDVVYVPSADWLIFAIAILGSPFGKLRYLLLYVSPKHHLFSSGIGNARRRDPLYQLLFRRLLRQPRLLAVLTIDPLLISANKRAPTDCSSKLQYVPDFADLQGNQSRDQCRKNLGWTSSDFVILAYGSITARKGVANLLRVLAHESAPANLRVLVAGLPDAGGAEVLDSPLSCELQRSKRLVLRPFFHNRQEEYEVFNSSDVVWLGYDASFTASSGVLHLAMQARRPVVASNIGLVAHLIRTYNIGELIEPANVNSVLGALNRIAKGHRQTERVDEGIARFAATHSRESHARVVIDALC